MTRRRSRKNNETNQRTNSNNFSMSLSTHSMNIWSNWTLCNLLLSFNWLTQYCWTHVCSSRFNVVFFSVCLSLCMWRVYLCTLELQSSWNFDLLIALIRYFDVTYSENIVNNSICWAKKWPKMGFCGHFHWTMDMLHFCDTIIKIKHPIKRKKSKLFVIKHIRVVCSLQWNCKM